jgi:hypothetical protein
MMRSDPLDIATAIAIGRHRTQDAPEPHLGSSSAWLVDEAVAHVPEEAARRGQQCGLSAVSADVPTRGDRDDRTPSSGGRSWVPQGNHQSSSSVTATEWRSQRGYLASSVSSSAWSRPWLYLASVNREEKLVPDNKVIVRFRVDKQIWRAIKVAAIQNDLTVSDYLGVVLEQAVSKSAPREAVKPRAPR